MKKIISIEDAQVAVRDLNNRLNFFEIGNIDLHQRRIINAGESVGKSDYVTRIECEALLRVLQVQVTDLVAEIQKLNIRLRNING